MGDTFTTERQQPSFINPDVMVLMTQTLKFSKFVLFSRSSVENCLSVCTFVDQVMSQRSVDYLGVVGSL
jgi:hypothetical protein